MNPWPMIGGVGISACAKNEFVVPKFAQKGDLMCMTKVLGT